MEHPSILSQQFAPPPNRSMRDRLREQVLGLRNRLLQDRTFQTVAASFPLTRGIARKRASEVFDLCAGFVYSQVLSACVETGLLELVAAHPRTIDAIAAEARLPVAGAQRLVDAAVAIGIFDRLADGRIMLGPKGAALRANGAALAMVRHHALLYEDLRDPVALLRREGGATQLSRYWGYAGDDPELLERADVESYSRLMSETQPMVAAEVLAAYDFRQHALLMDVGGGDGAFATAVARTAPDLRLVVFDLPAVAEIASERLRSEGLAGRARAIGGSFSTDPLPSGADAISLVRVLLDHSDETVLTILRACRKALSEGGRLVVAEQLAGTPGAEGMGDAYFGLYLWAMGKGRPRTASALSQLMKSAGFSGIRQVPTRQPLLTGLLVATAE